MSIRDSKRGFVARLTDPEARARRPDSTAIGDAKGEFYTARLTIDVTPEQRGRIKVTAFQRGLTVADMLRELFARESPDKPGGAS